jgi:hypothetical protein
VSFRMVALGLPTKEVLIRDSQEHVSCRALAWDPLNTEVLIRDS